MISIVAAVAMNGVIGYRGTIPWRQATDSARFRSMVRDSWVIMGRTTYESHDHKFQGSIVVSKTMQSDGVCRVVRTPAEAIALAQGDAYVLGGERIFEVLLPIADRMYLTQIHAVVQGDTHFPAYNPSEWQPIGFTSHEPDALNEHAYSFLDLERIR